MNTTQNQRSPEEILEIERHKYFLSEQAGHDVGWEVAESDWDSKFASQFRQTDGSSHQSSFGQNLGKYIKGLFKGRAA